jgi:hypothetical protein
VLRFQSSAGGSQGRAAEVVQVAAQQFSIDIKKMRIPGIL